MASSVVKLDVGGTKYKTSLSTLTLVQPESMLARMVQQDRVANIIQNGEHIFIDRNGTLFEYVLEFLRNPTAKIPWLPKDTETLQRLEVEADYFGVEGLKGLIHQSLNHPKLTDYISAHLKNPEAKIPWLPDDEETLTQLMGEAQSCDMAALNDIIKSHIANPIWPGHCVKIKEEVIEALENVPQDRKGPGDHTVLIQELGELKDNRDSYEGKRAFVVLRDVKGVVGMVTGKSKSTCVVQFPFSIHYIAAFESGGGHNLEWEIRKESLFKV